MLTFGVLTVPAGAMSISGLTTAMYKLGLGAAFLAVALRLFDRWPTRAVARAAAPAGMVYGVHVGLMFSAFQATSLANATIIVALQPAVALTVVGWLFGEDVQGRDLALTFVAIAGVALVVFGGDAAGRSDLRGDGLAVAGMLSATGYVVLAKRARVDGNVPVGEYQLGLLIVAVVTVAPLVVVLGDAAAMPAGWDWLRLVGLAGGGTAGHLGVNWAHRHVPLLVTSLLSLVVPVTSSSLAWVLLDERLSAAQALGAGVTLAALAVVVVRAVSPATEVAAHGDRRPSDRPDQ